MSREWSDEGCDDYGQMMLWERALENAMNGRRGQALLCEIEAELLAMQSRGENRLLRAFLVGSGAEITPNPYSRPEIKEFAPVGVCTLGCVARKKLPPDVLARYTDVEADGPWAHDELAKPLNAAEALIYEIGAINDGGRSDETDEQRFDRMLRWIQNHISRNGERITRYGKR